MLGNFLNITRSKEFYTIVITCCVAFLCMVGLLSVYSVTSVGNVEAGITPFNDLFHQIAFVAIGVILCIALARTPQLFNVSSHVIRLFWLICVVGIFLVAVAGTTVNGAKRWISIGSITLQPSEFLKIALVLMLVKILGEWTRSEIDSRRALIGVLVTVVAPLVFLFITQRDLGTTFVAVVCLLGVAYLAKVDLRIIFGIIIAGFLGVLCMAVFGSDFRSERFSYLNPWDDGQGGYGSGYNIIRSYYAIASGGVFGSGIGGSHEKYDYLYAADNDFIFAVICEEMGFVGGACVILCVVAIFFCCMKIASSQKEMETKLVLYGAGFLLLVSSLLNIGCTVGVFPTTGKPLPFVSSGGSSLIASFMLLGIILNCVLHSKVQTRSDVKRSKIDIYTRRGHKTSSRQRPRATSKAAYSTRNSP